MLYGQIPFFIMAEFQYSAGKCGKSKSINVLLTKHSFLYSHQIKQHYICYTIKYSIQLCTLSAIKTTINKKRIIIFINSLPFYLLSEGYCNSQIDFPTIYTLQATLLSYIPSAVLINGHCKTELNLFKFNLLQYFSSQ